MSFARCFALSTTLFSATSALAAPATPPAPAKPAMNPSNEAILESSCTCKGTDPYRTDDRIPAGPYKGQCFSSCVARSIRVLSKEEGAKFGAHRGEIAIANVVHEGRLHVAVVDPAAVEDVIVHVENFAPGAAHAELRFRFDAKQPARLTPQILEDRKKIKPFTLADLVFSVEANTPISAPGFNVSLSWMEMYGLVWRMVSLDTKYEFMVTRQKHKVEQYRLSLTPEQKNRMFRTAVFYGSQAAQKQMYHLLGRSCVTEMFRVIDSTISYRGDRWVIKTALDFMRHLPTLIPQALGVRELLYPNNGSVLPTLDEEYAARKPAAVGKRVQ